MISGTTTPHPDGLESPNTWTTRAVNGTTMTYVCPICKTVSNRDSGAERFELASTGPMLDPKRVTYAAWTCSPEHATQWREGIEGWRDA